MTPTWEVIEDDEMYRIECIGIHGGQKFVIKQYITKDELKQAKIELGWIVAENMWTQYKNLVVSHKISTGIW